MTTIVYGRTKDGNLGAVIGRHGYINQPEWIGYIDHEGRAIQEWTKTDVIFRIRHGDGRPDSFMAYCEDELEHETQLGGLGRHDVHVGTGTPWGAPQRSTWYGEGITFHSTAGHGGFELSDARNDQIAEVLRNDTRFYEEDVEWAKVAWSFQSLFTKKELRSAERTLINYYPDEWEALNAITLLPGQSFVRDQQEFEQANKANWIVISASKSKTQPGIIDCVATLGGRRGGRERIFQIPEADYSPGRFGFVIDLQTHSAKAA